MSVLGLWAVALAGSAAALPSKCVPLGSTVTCTFFYTGAARTFTVPNRVSSIVVDARGAAGGESGGTRFPHAAGGLGGRVQGTLAVTPGETLQVNVGGQGGRDGSEVGGWNGGGFGGAGGVCNCAPQISGGGGGASDIRDGSDTLADRVLVAAGGGGGGGYGNSEAGPAGAGGPGGGSSSDGTLGASFGSASGGGPGLAGSTSVISNGGAPGGGNGGLGTGGNGPGLFEGIGGDGGGGGGGYYGGGAGGSGAYGGGGVGGGSGGGGGGGGSNFTGSATSTTVTDGYQSGNGQVTITYTRPLRVTSVSPTSGPAAGGTPITITGQGFQSGDQVVIGQGKGPLTGAIPATSVSVNSPDQITAITGGPAKPGTWGVWVIGPDGSSASSPILFTYAPKITSVSPTSGPAAGGTPITITGQGFLSGDQIVIGQGKGPLTGAIPATVSVDSPTQITATTGGPAKAGTFGLYLIAPDGTISKAPHPFTYATSPPP